jgi:hypothetical protein
METQRDSQTWERGRTVQLLCAYVSKVYLETSGLRRFNQRMPKCCGRVVSLTPLLWVESGRAWTMMIHGVSLECVGNALVEESVSCENSNCSR